MSCMLKWPHERINDTIILMLLVIPSLFLGRSGIIIAMEKRAIERPNNIAMVKNLDRRAYSKSKSN